MANSGPGIKFSETMSGGIMLGETDYQAGAKAAQRSGDLFAMHAEVLIDDMERFIADKDHAGALSGTIDYTPFGLAIPCTQGKFNLFSPTGDPLMNYMIYELAFEHNGQSYYVAGHKEVKDDPGFDLWSDTTTLFTKLHRGSDSSGEVIGSGILSLGVSDLIKLVASMEVINADGLADKAETLGNFGKFFLGELWDTYAAKVG